MYLLEIARLLDESNRPLSFVEDSLDIPKVTMEKLVDQVGCNLAGGLKLLGFFAFSTRLVQPIFERLLAKLRAHEDLFQEAAEFNSPELFLFTHTGKSYRVDTLILGDAKVTVPVERFRRASEVVTSVHLFVNKTFYVAEKVEEPDDSEDPSIQYNVG